MTAIATTPLVHPASGLLKPLFALFLLVGPGCASAPGESAPAAAATSPVAAGTPIPTILQPNPTVPMLFGPGFTPASEQWVGTWVFKKSGFQFEIVEAKGKLSVSMSLSTSSTASKPCEDVVVGAELSCTVHGPRKRELAIALRPATTETSRLEHVTLIVGGVPVEVGGHYFSPETHETSTPL